MERPYQTTGVYIESRIINLVSKIALLGKNPREEGFFGGQASRKWGLRKFWGDDLKWLEFELAAHN